MRPYLRLQNAPEKNEGMAEDPAYLLPRAKFVAANGGIGVHVNIWSGLGAYKSIRESDLGLYIHYQKSGDKVISHPGNAFGISWRVLCQLAAYCGVDTIHAGMWGGYLSDPEVELRETLRILHAGDVVPALSCGLTAELVKPIADKFGRDWMANVGAQYTATLEAPPPAPEKYARPSMRCDSGMLLIAHRGLMQGPNRSVENLPSQIGLALGRGYDAEIDVWRQSGQWALGHESANYAVDIEFLHQPGLWIHCKNLDAFFALKGMSANKPNYFWHESDMVALTSSGHVWTYFGKPETESPASICVLPETSRTIEQIKLLRDRKKWYAICSDHVEEISR